MAACSLLDCVWLLFPSPLFPKCEFGMCEALCLPVDTHVRTHVRDFLVTGHMERAFNSDKGEFDLVVHLAAETKYGQEDEVYRQLVTDVAVAVGQECGRRGISKFIYLSTAQIYKPGKVLWSSLSLVGWSRVKM